MQEMMGRRRWLQAWCVTNARFVLATILASSVSAVLAPVLETVTNFQDASTADIQNITGQKQDGIVVTTYSSAFA